MPSTLRRFNRVRVALPVASTVVSVLVLSGCGGGSSDPRPSLATSPTPTPSPTASPSPTPPPIPAGFARYTVTRLVPNTGGFNVADVNASWQVAGSQDIGTGVRGPIARLQAGVLTPVSAFDASGNFTQITGQAVAINASGEVLGFVQNAGALPGTGTPFVTSGAQTTLLSEAVFNNVNQNIAALIALNDRGDILAQTTIPATPTTPARIGARLLRKSSTFRYEPVNLPQPDGRNLTVTALNALGTVVGHTVVPERSGLEAAFSFQNGNLTVLPALSPGGITFANSVNNAGVVGGSARDANAIEQPVLWTGATAAPTLLPLPAGATGGVVRSVNDDRLAVGVALGSDASRIPMVWQNGVGVELNRLLPTSDNVTLTDATRVLNGGRILAFGRQTVTGQPPFAGYFLLTPQ